MFFALHYLSNYTYEQSAHDRYLKDKVLTDINAQHNKYFTILIINQTLHVFLKKTASYTFH